jgi:hypothetical protein
MTAATFTLGAQEITRATLYGAGFSNLYDTYLSPQEYRGVDFRVLRESTRATHWMQGKVSRQTLFQANVAYTHNRAGNNNTLAGMAGWNYGWHYNFRLTDSFRLLAGGLIDLEGGFVYNLRNGNNPASARASVGLDASGMAVWGVRLKGLPLTLRAQLSVPLMGLCFSPHYGQSYYEIFTLGNSGGVVQFTSLHNRPSLRALLTADFPVGRIHMRLAYLWDAQQSSLNGIDTHTYSHVFLVGVIKKFKLVK